jgi:hypothetical protein
MVIAPDDLNLVCPLGSVDTTDSVTGSFSAQVRNSQSAKLTRLTATGGRLLRGARKLDPSECMNSGQHVNDLFGLCILSTNTGNYTTSDQ